MKKNLFTILLAFIVVFGVNAQKANSFSASMTGKKIHTIGKIVKQNNQVPKGVIMSETFAAGLPAGWQNVDNGTTGFVWTFDNPGGRTINTTTSADGFAILDSDNNGQVGGENADLITSAIDCSGNTTVILSFEHYFYSGFGGAAEVFVSGDNGANWTSLEAWSATSTANAEVATYDITAFAAGQSQVMVKWNWQGDYSWYWAIDDVVVAELDQFDVALTASNLGVYAITPISQFTAMAFEGNASNVGTDDVTNAIMTVIVNDGSSDVFTGVSDAIATLAAGANQDVVTNTNFTPTAAANFTVNYSLAIDETDANMANNVATANFAVNDSVMASDDGMANQGTLGIGDGTDGALGQLFTLNVKDTVTSVSFYIGADDTDPLGTETMNVIIYDFDGTTPTTLLYESPTYTSGTTAGWVTIELESPLVLFAGTYFFGLHELDINIHLARETDNYVPQTSWLYYDGQPWTSTDDFYPALNGTYLIRPNFGPFTPSTDATLNDLTYDGTSVTGFDPATMTYNVELAAGTTDVPTVVGTPTDSNATAVTTNATELPGSSTVEVTAQDGSTTSTYTINFTVAIAINDIASKGISVYPNPSNGTFTVNVENNFNLEVLDITGKVINTQVLNGTNTVTINNAGVYFLRFSNNEGSVTQKVIVQ